MMPITGTTVTVLGQNFMDIASITMGNRSVDLSTVTVSEANDMLTFTMPRAPQGTCHSPLPQWAVLPKFRASILWRI